MSPPLQLDGGGRRRSQATLPGYRSGRPPRNKGLRYPADPPRRGDRRGHARGRDDLIHRYKRSARELWKFCGASGSEWERAARTLAHLREEGEEPDWWQAGQPRGRRA